MPLKLGMCPLLIVHLLCVCVRESPKADIECCTVHCKILSVKVSQGLKQTKEGKM